MAKENPSTDDTRKAILDAAFHLFSTQGYNDTAMSAIAKKADISKGLIYHYFDSKKELLKEIFINYQSNSVAQISYSPADPALTNLNKLVDIAFHFLQNQGQIKRFSLLLNLQKDAIEEISDLVGHQQKNNGNRPSRSCSKRWAILKPVAEAFYLSALLDGIALRYLATENYPLEGVKNLVYRNYKIDGR